MIFSTTGTYIEAVRLDIIDGSGGMFHVDQSYAAATVGWHPTKYADKILIIFFNKKILKCSYTHFVLPPVPPHMFAMK